MTHGNGLTNSMNLSTKLCIYRFHPDTLFEYLDKANGPIKIIKFIDWWDIVLIAGFLVDFLTPLSV